MQVFLNFGVYYDGFEEMQHQKEQEKKQLNDTLATIEVGRLKPLKKKSTTLVVPQGNNIACPFIHFC